MILKAFKKRIHQIEALQALARRIKSHGLELHPCAFSGTPSVFGGAIDELEDHKFVAYGTPYFSMFCMRQPFRVLFCNNVCICPVMLPPECSFPKKVILAVRLWGSIGRMTKMIDDAMAAGDVFITAALTFMDIPVSSKGESLAEIAVKEDLFSMAENAKEDSVSRHISA